MAGLFPPMAGEVAFAINQPLTVVPGPSAYGGLERHPKLLDGLEGVERYPA